MIPEPRSKLRQSHLALPLCEPLWGLQLTVELRLQEPGVGLLVEEEYRHVVFSFSVPAPTLQVNVVWPVLCL